MATREMSPRRWTRLLVDEARWQELMDSGAEELELKLTAEQYRVVRAPGPVLLSGSRLALHLRPGWLARRPPAVHEAGGAFRL